MAIDTNKTIEKVKYKGINIPIVGVLPPDKSVFIFTPDNQLIAEYTTDEFLALSEYPVAPTISGLTFQEYNWTLAQAKSYVTDCGALIIGATYTTTSNLTEIDITINKSTGLNFTLQMSGTKDWGDGTSDTSTAHTYSTYGNYTIKCNGTINNTSSGSRMFGSQNDGAAVETIKFSSVITSIPTYACAGCSATAIFIPNSITTIYSYSFNGCNRVGIFVFPKSISSIMGSACYSCGSLKYVSLGRGVTYIDSSAFSYCKIKMITVPDTLTALEANTFNNDTLLEWVTLPSSLDRIKNQCFQYCNQLFKINIPQNITRIDQNAFNGCTKLQNIELPSGLLEVGQSVFSGCSNIKSIKFNSTSSIIGSSAFNGCTSLEELILPTSTTSTSTIGFVFNSCYKLKNITIPTGTKLSNNCFYSNYSLTSLTIPAATTTIQQQFCYYCYSLNSVTALGDITSIASDSFVWCPNVLTYDFSHCSAVPTLASQSAFNGYNRFMKILVPDALYETWIAETNWTALAGFIYKASEV